MDEALHFLDVASWTDRTQERGVGPPRERDDVVVSWMLAGGHVGEHTSHRELQWSNRQPVEWQNC